MAGMELLFCFVGCYSSPRATPSEIPKPQMEAALVAGALAAMDAATNALQAAASRPAVRLPAKALFAQQLALILEHGGLLMREAAAAAAASAQQQAAVPQAAVPPATTAVTVGAASDGTGNLPAKRPRLALAAATPAPATASRRRAPPLPLTELPAATVVRTLDFLTPRELSVVDAVCGVFHPVGLVQKVCLLRAGRALGGAGLARAARPAMSWPEWLDGAQYRARLLAARGRGACRVAASGFIGRPFELVVDAAGTVRSRGCGASGVLGHGDEQGQPLPGTHTHLLSPTFPLSLSLSHTHTHTRTHPASTDALDTKGGSLLPRPLPQHPRHDAQPPAPLQACGRRGRGV